MVTVRLLPLLALAALWTAMPASAEERPRAVLELFTSQGCSSCPPADKIHADLARDPTLIALSLPVDYWDYLGWKDTLASGEHSARQRAYAKGRGERQVFTPQTVINGAIACIGSDRAKIDRYLVKAQERGLTLAVPLQVKENGGTLVVELGEATGDTPRAAEIWALSVARTRAVAIGRGENRGRDMTYVNVVRGLKRLGAWTGAKQTIETPLAGLRIDGADSYVVLLQVPAEQAPGRILGAAKGPGL